MALPASGTNPVASSTTPLISLPGTATTSTSATSTQATSTADTSTTSSTTSATTSSVTSTTSSSTTDTTSSTTSSSTTSSTTSASSSSATTSSSSSTTSSSSPVVIQTSSQISTFTSDGETQTSVIVVTPSQSSLAAGASSSAQNDSTSGNSGFFSNKGAVAGVFTVVGLVALAAVIFVLTGCLRRRRQRRYDRDSDEAAAVAAATSRATPPYLDDEDDAFSGAKARSETTHGTYAQPPMAQVYPEAYGMREMPPGMGGSSGPAPGGASANPFDPAYGMAGVGVSRARSRKDNGFDPNAFNEGSTPYNAFAAPGGYDLTGGPGMGGDPYADTSRYYNHAGGYNPYGDAAGPGGPSNLARNQSQYTSPSSQQTHTTNTSALNRAPSVGVGGLYSGNNSVSTEPTQESYAAHYQPTFRPNAYKGPAQERPISLPDPYAGIEPTPDPTTTTFKPSAQHGQGQMELHAPDTPEERSLDDEPLHHHELEDTMSLRDDEDYGGGRRVLRVANE